MEELDHLQWIIEPCPFCGGIAEFKNYPHGAMYEIPHKFECYLVQRFEIDYTPITTEDENDMWNKRLQ